MDCTFLSRKQILRVYELFKKYDADDDGTLEKDEFVKIPDFAANPFIERISEVFSQDGTGDIQFEDFLDFMSIFSSQVLEINFFFSDFFSFFFPRNGVNPFFLSFFLQATPDVKVAYAFRIYGGPHLALIFLVEEIKENNFDPFFSLSLLSTDFDEDGYLGISDIQQTLEFLVGNEMTEGEKAEIVATVGFFSLLLLVVVNSSTPVKPLDAPSDIWRVGH